MGPSYKAMLGTHVHNANAKVISFKVGKEGKHHGKNLSPKKRAERGCMDGWSNQDPPITTYIQYIQ